MTELRGVSGLRVVKPGPRTTVQDAGRSGYAHLGVPRAGAVDLASLRSANLGVGNSPDAAGVEITIGGLIVTAVGDVEIAVGGPDVVATVDGEALAAPYRTVLLDGSRLAVSSGSEAVYSYLAVAGGVDVPPVLGSRSRDTLTGIGPAQLAAGDVVLIGRGPVGERVERQAVVASSQSLLLLPGPHLDRFPAGAFDQLLQGGEWTVGPRSDRTALRLDGPPVVPSRHDLPSEGLVPGAVQVPPDGQPILFLANHPTTGGYPLIGVVAADDVGRAAQLRPGRSLRFRAS